MDRYSKKTRDIIEYAKELADSRNDYELTTGHLLAGICHFRDELSEILAKHGVREKNVIAYMNNDTMFSRPNVMVEGNRWSDEAERVLRLSERKADEVKASLIMEEHLILVMMEFPDCQAYRIMEASNVIMRFLYMEVSFRMHHYLEEFTDRDDGEENDEEPFSNDDDENSDDTDYEPFEEEEEEERIGFRRGRNRSDSDTPLLDKYSHDLTKSAREGKLDAVIGREDEINRVVQILSRRTKNNPCLIGEPGVGKTAIAEGLALEIVSDNAPDTIRNKRVVCLDLAACVAGTKYRGEFEERLKKILDEVSNAGNVLLFIDEMHSLIHAGDSEGTMDAGNILKPVLARGEMQVIGATTTAEFRKYIEKDAALARRFQPVMIEEPGEEDTIEILKGLRKAYEDHHCVEITDEAVEAAVKLSVRYINDRFLPDKAIDLLDEAASKLRINVLITPKEIKELEKQLEELEDKKRKAIQSEEFEAAGKLKEQQDSCRSMVDQLTKEWENRKNNERPVVTAEDIASVVSTWTGIPVTSLTKDEIERLRNLENELHRRVIGQDEAVSAIAKAIRRGRAGLKDPGRPIGSFLFLGPTGVGKTELCKAIAEAMFGSEKSIIRFDMSEYMEKTSVNKLIGSDPGFVGYEEGGQLSNRVRKQPYSVVLFDEVEKAHPDVMNLLLQVFDEGRVTDNQGRKVDFKNTILIMTSNLGAQNILSPKSFGFNGTNGADSEEMKNEEQYRIIKSRVMEDVNRAFRPEFINRIDEILVFRPLTRTNVGNILNLMIQGISKRFAEKIKIQTEVDEKAREVLIREGFDEKYGARPLRRVLQNKLEDRIVEEYLDGSIREGDHIRFTCEGNSDTLIPEKINP